MGQATKQAPLLEKLRNGEDLTLRQQLRLILSLAYPAVIATMTTVVVEYIDAAMVGRLGADKAASIGLMSTTIWLVGGVVGAFATGFQVQAAHRIGAKEEREARTLVRHSLVLSVLFSLVLMTLGLLFYRRLPYLLGGEGQIALDAARYIIVFVMMLPVLQVSRTAGGMLQSSGNMKVAGAIDVLICVLDAIFNFVFIFETRTVTIGSAKITIYGAGLDVQGAALGSLCAEGVGMLLMLYYLFFRSSILKQRRSEIGWTSETSKIIKSELKKAVKIGGPVALENIIMNSAQIRITTIVAPLGAISIAANSFAISAEAFCYMPAYGVAIAATTLIGQSIGANRKKLAGRFGYFVTGIGMIAMVGMGVLLYVLAPWMMRLLSPDPAIQALGTEVLRIEAFAEPLFAASIVIGGVFRGAGKTLGPTVMNLISMWAIRIPLATYFAPKIGLRGVWIAMCAELMIRGILFLVMLVVWKKRMENAD